MIFFSFTVRKSFLNYSTHPITVPQRQVDHKKIKQEELDKGDLTIIFPKGERIRGHMYSGRANGTYPYYQIRSCPDQKTPKYLSCWDKVIVLLYKDRNHRYSTMEYRD